MLQYSHTAHQRIPASEQTQPVQMLSQLLKMKPQVYMELREHLDRLSLFTGRNPLVSSVAVL